MFFCNKAPGKAGAVRRTLRSVQKKVFFFVRQMPEKNQNSGIIYWYRWWFQFVSIFTPKIGEAEPILMSIFSDGLVKNHQPDCNLPRLYALVDENRDSHGGLQRSTLSKPLYIIEILLFSTLISQFCFFINFTFCCSQNCNLLFELMCN